MAVATPDAYAPLTGIEPVVAMLSFSTLGSADHPAVTKVRRATELVRAARPDLLVDGELQLGSDHVAAVGAASAVHSEVAGRANMVILPDLGGGNIGYMITERLAWATAIGPDPPGRGQATQRPVPRMQHDRHRHRGADERHAVN